MTEEQEPDVPASMFFVQKLPWSAWVRLMQRGEEEER